MADPIPPNQSLTPHAQTDMQISAFEKTFTSIMGISKTLVKSGILPSAYTKPEQVAFAIIRGRELGIPTTTALQGLYPIGSNFGMYGWLMIALVRKSGLLEKFELKDEQNQCTCTVKRKGSNEISVTFTKQNAIDMGLVKPNSAWTKQLVTMLRWRAISANLRLTFPDVTGGMYLPDELDPTLMVNLDPEDIVVTEDGAVGGDDYADKYQQAMEALRKLEKKGSREELDRWTELWKDDVKNFPQNLKDALLRQYRLLSAKYPAPPKEPTHGTDGQSEQITDGQKPDDTKPNPTT